MPESNLLTRSIKSLVPYGVVMALVRARNSRRDATIKRKLSEQGSTRDARGVRNIPFAHQAAIEFHTARGLPFEHVRDGSIPEQALDYCSRALDDAIKTPAGQPILGLHVGNFVGVSLCHFLSYVQRRNPASVVVSIDPNLSHRGIRHPQDHAIALANYFGLQRNLVVCAGYSGAKSVSNDGKTFDDEAGKSYDPFASFDVELSCEQQLLNLSRISAGRFDFAVLDGNHEADYLVHEVDIVANLLKPGGILILDDVSVHWDGIQKQFVDLQSKGWRSLGADGQVGILQLNTPAAGEGAAR